MKLPFFIITLILSTNSFSQIPKLSWVDIGKADHTKHVIDNEKNIIIFGEYSYNGYFGINSNYQNIKSKGSSDIFIQKLDSNGNQLWFKTIGSQFSEECHSIAIDKDNNLLLFGNFSNELDFDPNEGTSLMYNKGSDSFDCFILKLDKNGNYIWVKTFGTKIFDHAKSIKIDLKGNIYLLGSYDGYDVDLDPSPNSVYELPQYGYDDIFITKLDSNAEFIWSKSIGGNYLDYGIDLNIDNVGNIYLLGKYSGVAIFNDSLTFYAEGADDYFLQKINSNGDFLWMKNFDEHSYLYINKFEIDPENGIYILGQYQKVIQNYPYKTDNFMFLEKLNSQGQVLLHKEFKFEKPFTSNGIVFSMGNIFISGKYSKSVNFGDEINEIIISSENQNERNFVLKLDSTLNFLDIYQFETSVSFIENLTKDDEGNIYLSGNFAENLNILDKNEQDSLTFYLAGTNYFFLKLGAPSKHISWLKPEDYFIIFPNPSSNYVHFESNTLNELKIDFYNLIGERIKEIQVGGLNGTFDVSELPEGIYFLSVKNQNKNICSVKLIKY